MSNDVIAAFLATELADLTDFVVRTYKLQHSLSLVFYINHETDIADSDAASLDLA